MKPAELRSYLDVFDNLNKDTPLEARQLSTIQTLRMLARSANEAADLTSSVD
jgi:hypothetical protein